MRRSTGLRNRTVAAQTGGYCLARLPKWSVLMSKPLSVIFSSLSGTAWINSPISMNPVARLGRLDRFRQKEHHHQCNVFICIFTFSTTHTCQLRGWDHRRNWSQLTWEEIPNFGIEPAPPKREATAQRGHPNGTSHLARQWVFFSFFSFGLYSTFRLEFLSKSCDFCWRIDLVALVSVFDAYKIVNQWRKLYHVQLIVVYTLTV